MQGVSFFFKETLRREVGRQEREAAAARGEARTAEARALQLQRLVDAQAEYVTKQIKEYVVAFARVTINKKGTADTLRTDVEPRWLSRKLRELELRTSAAPHGERDSFVDEGADESRAELRARLSEAERLVRRLRADADRQRREVLASAADGVTNLLFDGAHATQAHVCHARQRQPRPDNALAGRRALALWGPKRGPVRGRVQA